MNHESYQFLAINNFLNYFFLDIVFSCFNDFYNFVYADNNQILNLLFSHSVINI